MLNLIIYFVAIVLVVFFLVITITYVRSKIGMAVYSPLIIQPYSGNIIKKNYFLSLALLETPIILTAVCSISFYDLIFFDGLFFLSWIPFIYLFFIGIASAISIYFTALSMPNFFSIFGAHPQYESSLLMQFLILCSSLQAPFIIFVVSLFIHKSYFYGNFHLFSNQKYILIFLVIHFLFLLLVQYGVMRSIKNIVNQLCVLYEWFPENIKNIFIVLIMQIGFLQAPYIFSFIAFLLLMQVYIMVDVRAFLIFSVFALAFGAIGYTIVSQSGNTVQSALKSANFNISRNKSIFNLSVLSQIFLDARILYILILLLVSLSQIH